MKRWLLIYVFVVEKEMLKYEDRERCLQFNKFWVRVVFIVLEVEMKVFLFRVELVWF